MPDIPREVTEQLLRRFDEEKHKIIEEEVHKLLMAGFIKEVHHPKWLANPMLVKKKNAKMRSMPKSSISFTTH